MKLCKLLTLLADNEQIYVYDDRPNHSELIFEGTVIECYGCPEVLKRKITFSFPAHYEMVIFVK